MLKYAKIFDETNKSCLVGLGDNEEYYKSLGFEKLDVEEAYNGTFYLKGYAPEEPEEVIKQRRINELKDQLNATDYKIIKCSECSLAGEPLPYDIAELHAQRQAIRDEINALGG